MEKLLHKLVEISVFIITGPILLPCQGLRYDRYWNPMCVQVHAGHAPLRLEQLDLRQLEDSSSRQAITCDNIAMDDMESSSSPRYSLTMAGSHIYISILVIVGN